MASTTAFVAACPVQLGASATHTATSSAVRCSSRVVPTQAATGSSKNGSTFAASSKTFAAKANFFGSSLPVARRSIKAAATKFTIENKVGELLEDFLNENAEPDLRRLLMDLADAIRTIAYKVRTAACSATSCFNSFGDEQLAVDVLADNLLFDALRRCGCCASASSEEQSDVITMNEGGKYSVAFDPLDGSSIIDTNFAVGTIFGVWPGKDLVGVTGEQQVASGIGVYGPRTTLMLALDKGAHEFLLEQDGSWVHVRETYEIQEGKLFAPGNLRATMDNPEYKKLVDFWLTEKYQLRYTGGMVPDVNQIIIKGKGVFCNPASPSAPAKLRVLYEVAPLGKLIEAAGGASSDGEKSVLKIKVNNTEDRTQVCYGSKGEVKRFEEYLAGKTLAGKA